MKKLTLTFSMLMLSTFCLLTGLSQEKIPELVNSATPQAIQMYQPIRLDLYHPILTNINTPTYLYHSIETMATRSTLDDEAKLFSSKSPNLDPKVVKLALLAYKNAVKKGITHSKLLTIVDYSKPSKEPRFWVLNLDTHEVLYHELVAHGKYTGMDTADSFSNAPKSRKSSLGLFITEDTYTGKHGYSLRINGLEKGFNDHAKARDIVIHSSNYVNQLYAKTKGRIGRSFGCLALDPLVSTKIINLIKNGTLIFAYHPSTDWLRHSQFLNA